MGITFPDPFSDAEFIFEPVANKPLEELEN